MGMQKPIYHLKFVYLSSNFQSKKNGQFLALTLPDLSVEHLRKLTLSFISLLDYRVRLVFSLPPWLPHLLVAYVSSSDLLV